MTWAGVEQFLGEVDRRRLVRLCAVISGSPEAAEDLAQETMLEAWRHQHKLADPAGLDRWVAAIARNVCRRWARREGRDISSVSPLRSDFDFADADIMESDLERAELLVLLKRALALLPPQTREALIHRYVHESSHAEIAGRLGLSTEAVAMRLHRGKSALRRLLEPELEERPEAVAKAEGKVDGWKHTRARCTACGTSALRMRTDAASRLLSFWCPGCSPDPAQLSHQYRLGNPHFGRLFRDLTKPTVILARAAEWSCGYFQAGIERGYVPCTQCGRQLAVQQFVREGRADSRSQRGIVATCEGCGEQVCSSAEGMALALPQVRSFLGQHPAGRLSPAMRGATGAGDTLVVGVVDGLGRASVDVVFVRDTLRLLKVEPRAAAIA